MNLVPSMTPPPKPPFWKQVFDSVEQAAGPVMANATASSGFAEIMKVSTKISRDMADQSETLSRRWLHAWNLPAAGDVAGLKAQVGSLEAEVRSLRRLLEEQNSSSPAAKKAPARKAAAKRKPAAKSTRKPAKKPAVVS